MAEQKTDIDWNNLTPDNPDIMQYQATINIGRRCSVWRDNVQERLVTSPTESPQW